MNLQEINVLIDGYNLELIEGTGIKTYSATLVKALISLGANVDLLYSRYTNNSNSILTEALFFDIQNSHKTSSIAKNILWAAIQQIQQVQEIQISDFVIKKEADFIFDYLAKSSRVFNIQNCYTKANNLYKYLQISTYLKIPKKIDIWHTTYPLPIKVNHANIITTIHDLIPLKLPYTSLDNKKFFFSIIKNSLKNSKIVLTVSENTKKDILDCFDLDPEKIYVTYQPILDNSFLIQEDKINVFLKKYKLNYKKYILFVGAIEPKKNVGRLIDAYTAIDTDMQLVIVGKKAWLWESEIGKLERIYGKNFSRKVKLLEYVTKRDLAYLYKGAFCFVFPSLYEGFGLPPLEAMSFGCPVITSNVSSLPEICGDAALYVDPYNFDEIRQAIEKLIDNPHLQLQLSSLGKQRVNLFNMENYRKKLYEAYTKVI